MTGLAAPAATSVARRSRSDRNGRTCGNTGRKAIPQRPERPHARQQRSQGGPAATGTAARAATTVTRHPHGDRNSPAPRPSSLRLWPPCFHTRPNTSRGLRCVLPYNYLFRHMCKSERSRYEHTHAQVVPRSLPRLAGRALLLRHRLGHIGLHGHPRGRHDPGHRLDGSRSGRVRRHP